MKSYMRVAPKRRHVPTNSAPLEVYWMLFFLPNYRIVVDCVGVGFQREPVTAQVWYRQLFFLLHCMYRKQWAPVEWAHSEVILLSKDPHKTDPCARSRLIFSFDPMGNSFSFNCRDSKMWPFTISLVMHTCHIADGRAPFYSLRQCRRNSHQNKSRCV